MPWLLMPSSPTTISPFFTHHLPCNHDLHRYRSFDLLFL
jgi:hypothetical protein